MNFAILIAGQPRNAEESLPRLKQQAPAETLFLGFVWDKPNAANIVGKEAYTSVDVERVKSLASAGFSSREPVSFVPEQFMRWASREQEIVKELGLRPNPPATFSWLSALSEAGNLARELPPGTTVLLTRSDIS